MMLSLALYLSMVGDTLFPPPTVTPDPVRDACYHRVVQGIHDLAAKTDLPMVQELAKAKLQNGRFSIAPSGRLILNLGLASVKESDGDEIHVVGILPVKPGDFPKQDSWYDWSQKPVLPALQIIPDAFLVHTTSAKKYPPWVLGLQIVSARVPGLEGESRTARMFSGAARAREILTDLAPDYKSLYIQQASLLAENMRETGFTPEEAQSLTVVESICQKLAKLFKLDLIKDRPSVELIGFYFGLDTYTTAVAWAAPKEEVDAWRQEAASKFIGVNFEPKK